MIYRPSQVVIFYSISSPFSQFYPCRFTVTEHSEYKDDEHIIFTSTEQYMHYRNAQTFGDLKTAKKIITESDPAKIKTMGRRVKYFISNDWDKVKFNIVRQGNIYKFSQNENLKKIMITTKNKVFIEASPWDKIWGVGMGKTNSNIYDTDKWKGTNLLGKALESARRYIVTQEKKKTNAETQAIEKLMKKVKGVDLNK